MKTITVTSKNINDRDFKKRSAKESDYSTLIKEPCIIKVGDEVKIIYDELDIDCLEVLNAVRKIKYTVNIRSHGLKTISRIFGFKPRQPQRGDFCTASTLAREFPKENAIVAEFAEKIEKSYEKYHPEGFKFHKESIKEILPEYKIGKTVFTSGIINKNNPLKYHYDTGNYNKVYSCMLVMKGGTEGGYLSIPDYDIGIELKNNSILMFDGQSIMHGVTPIRYTSPFGYRYSIVYYSLKRLWKCLTIDDELIRVRTKKMEREKRRHNMTPEYKKYLESLAFKEHNL